jgi:hypothetical protein
MFAAGDLQGDTEIRNAVFLEIGLPRVVIQRSTPSISDETVLDIVVSPRGSVHRWIAASTRARSSR